MNGGCWTCLGVSDFDCSKDGGPKEHLTGVFTQDLDWINGFEKSLLLRIYCDSI